MSNDSIRLSITNVALKFIDNFLSKRGKAKLLQILVVPQGNGFSYQLMAVDGHHPNKHIMIPFPNKVFIVVSISSIKHLNGSVLHYISTSTESGLKIFNPWKKFK